MENKTVFCPVLQRHVTARKDDDSRVYQFLFDADFYFVITPEVIPTMYYLDQDNTIRSEVIE